jgi:hypothetical protein
MHFLFNSCRVILNITLQLNSLGWFLYCTVAEPKNERYKKVAPHKADLLVLSGVAEYIYIKPPKGQRLQGIKHKELRGEKT